VDNKDISPRNIKILLDKNKISCEVVTSSSSEALLDLSEKIKPEIVIVDFDFFNIDPVGTVRKIRHFCPQAHIIAFADPRQRQNLSEAIEEGLNDYLIKPLQPEDLMLRIKIAAQALNTTSDTVNRQEMGFAEEGKDFPPSPKNEMAEDQTRIAAESPQEEHEHGNIRYFSKTSDPKPAGGNMSASNVQTETVRDNRVLIPDFAEDEADDFEDMVMQAKMLSAENPEEAIKLFYRAVDHYQQEYFAASTADRQNFPGSSYHQEIFVSAVYDLVDLLKERKAYEQIIKLCEKASEVEYFEEGIHIRLIEAMLAEGMAARARAHYDEVTSTFSREMGVKPSSEMRKLYEQGGLETGSYEIDLITIQNDLKSSGLANGALFCDVDQFRYSYKLEQLRCERNGLSVFLCMLALIDDDYAIPPEDLLEKTAENLKNVILHSLRKGDLVTSWKDGQFLLLLPGLNREEAARVMDRIESAYSRSYSLQGLKMQKKIESLFPLEGDSHFN
jgi:two-component SAPR family response regulator